MVGRAHGVYALYKGDHLYYVGLASNLRSRIRHHLKDRHARKWDKFSLYLVRKADHIRELESLIMRIANPKGNAAVGKLKRAMNLRTTLKIRLRQAQAQALDEVFGSREVKTVNKRTVRRRVARGRKTARKQKAAVLAPYVTKGFTIRCRYKGQIIRAHVWRSGKIRFNGTTYNSPSVAASAVGKGARNGWSFWNYRNSSGEWVPLRNIRKRKAD